MNKLNLQQESKKINERILELKTIKESLYSEKFYCNSLEIFNENYNSSNQKGLFYGNDDFFTVLGSKLFLPENFYKSYPSNKRLEDFNLDELIAKLAGNNYDYYEFKRILFLINKLRFSLWLEKTIDKLSKVLKSLVNTSKNRLQNKREFIRKLFSFNFKNLDDTHSTIIFN